ncbi:HNH endonuclease [Aquipuribacter sp. MA13-6]|uniref:HNH endonuclease n=1 Tax=unclassified Aquipuribacter TaxID=2635084 RepID=UPI003EF03F01
MSQLTALATGWRDLSPAVGDDADRIDLIRALEVVKAAASAAQACLAADLDASQRQEQAAAGVPAAERGRGVAAQVALARRDSPHRGGRHLGLAKALVHEMPHTLAALQAGRISEWRAAILVRETAVLTADDRAAVDLELAGSAERVEVLEQLGDRALGARAKQAAYRLDPHSVVERARRAVGERCVTLRAAPDTWCDAPVRHVDHVVPHAAGGPTSSHNSQGLCESCNHIRQALGWHGAVHDPPADLAAPGSPRRHTVITTTPTGHTYVSTAPPLPGAPPGPPGADAAATADASATRGAQDAEGPDPSGSWVEVWMREHLATAA